MKPDISANRLLQICITKQNVKTSIGECDYMVHYRQLTAPAKTIRSKGAADDHAPSVVENQNGSTCFVGTDTLWGIHGASNAVSIVQLVDLLHRSHGRLDIDELLHLIHRPSRGVNVVLCSAGWPR